MRILLLTGVALLPLIIAQNLPAQQADPVEGELGKEVCCEPEVEKRCKQAGDRLDDIYCKCYCDVHPDEPECVETNSIIVSTDTGTPIGDTITSSINWDTVSTTTSVGDDWSTTSTDTGTPFGDTISSSINWDTVSTTTSVGDDWSTTSTDTGTPFGQPESSSSIIGQPESSSINWDTVSTTTSVGETTTTYTDTRSSTPESTISTYSDMVSTTTSGNDEAIRCERGGGRWVNGSGDGPDYCFCDDGPYGWDGTSCVSLENACKNAGGTWNGRYGCDCPEDEFWHCGSQCVPCSKATWTYCEQCTGWEIVDKQCKKIVVTSETTEAPITATSTTYQETTPSTTTVTETPTTSTTPITETTPTTASRTETTIPVTSIYYTMDKRAEACYESGGYWDDKDGCACYQYNGPYVSIVYYPERCGVTATTPTTTPRTETTATTEVTETTIPATTPTATPTTATPTTTSPVTSISYTTTSRTMTTTTPSRWGETTTSGSVTTISGTSSRTGTTVTGFESTDPVVSSSW